MRHSCEIKDSRYRSATEAIIHCLSRIEVRLAGSGGQGLILAGLVFAERQEFLTAVKLLWSNPTALRPGAARARLK